MCFVPYQMCCYVDIAVLMLDAEEHSSPQPWPWGGREGAPVGSELSLMISFLPCGGS